MATLADLRERTLRKLYGSPAEERPAVDTINNSGVVASGATSFTVSTASLWKVGDQVEFDDGEIATVTANASGVLTVLRAQRGTTAAEHADGGRITKNPVFPIADVDEAIEEVITNELWPRVWMWKTGTITWSTGDHVYDLPADELQVDVVYQLPSDEKSWKHLPAGWWDVEQQIHADVATNGVMLRIGRAWHASQPIYYVARQRPTFSGIADISDEVANVIPWGAAKKLVAARAAALSLDPSQNVRTDEGDISRDWRLLDFEFDRSVDRLHRKLIQDVRPEPRFRPRMRRSW